ncbi:MAG: lamin tail domain-containing protein [Blastocatellia bacterium]
MRKHFSGALVGLGLVIAGFWLAAVSAHVVASRHPVIFTTATPRAVAMAPRPAQQSPQVVSLVINEYLADPPGSVATDLIGDANGDGTRDATQDEFVELVNSGATPLNIGGFTISDATQVRYTIPANKIIPAGEAAVIFGGGTPMGAFGNAGANNLVFAVGGSGLSLNNGGDTITVKDTTATVVATVTFGATEGGADQSYTRSPDITGSFVSHSSAAGAGHLFSPGTRTNGSAFTTTDPIISSISPNVLVSGGGNTDIVVTGNNFVATSKVRVDGTQITTTFTNAMELGAAVPASVTNAPGAHFVTVENPGPVISNSVTLTVLSAVGINEYLADPPGSAAGDLIGDANGDGVRDSSDDEFIEVVNRTDAPIDIGGYALRDTDAVRFTFPAGTVIPANEAAVVFGGGTPTGDFGNARVNGLVFKAASTLSLNNTGDIISLLGAGSQVLESITYGSTEGGADQSINRNPEIFGTAFASHTTMPGNGGRVFSPGTLVNGTPFTTGPRLTDLMPNNAPRNSPPFDMMVHGTNFESTAKAYIDGSQVMTTFMSGGELKAQVPASVTVVAGNHNVQVIHEGGNRSNVLVLMITLTDPIIDSISPTAALVGSGEVPLTVTGHNFQAASQVRADGNAITTMFTDATHLEATVPASITNIAGMHSITVVNPGNVVSNIATFTVLGAVGINEYLADPPDGLSGDANGDGIRDSSDDEFVEVVNRTEQPINVGGYALRDTDAVRFTFPAGTIIPAGEAAVVFGGGTPTGDFGNARVNGLVFKASGGLSLNNGGDTISLLGTGSQVIESLTFTSVEGNANQSLNRNPEIFGTAFATHSSVAGSGGRVFSPGTLVNGTPFTAGPRLTSLMPDSVILNTPAFDMAVHGSSFESTAKVYIDGSAVTTTPINSGELKAHVPTSVTSVGGGHNVQVLHEGGNRSNVLILTVIATNPMITSISPNMAIAGTGDVDLTVTGHDFQATSKVRVDDTVVSTTFVSGSELDAVIPASIINVPGAHSITVQNPDLVVSNSVTFTVLSAVGINEYLADPPGSAATDLNGDANGDGVRSSSDDEFIELVNRTNDPINIGGYIIRDADAVRFTFPAGTVIPGGESAVVFGGGHPVGAFGNARANGLVFTANGGLSLNNGGDTISLLTGANQVIESITFGSTEGGANQSLNRKPEYTGGFVTHSSIPGSGGRLFSPGAQVNGDPFTAAPHITSIAPDSAPLNAPSFDLTIHGTDFDMTSRATIDGNIVSTTFVSPGELTARVPSIVTAVAGGHNVQVRYESGNRSNIVVLTIIPPPPVLSEVLPRVIQQGSANFVIFVRGENFEPASQVLVEGTGVATTFSNSRELRATVPASFAVNVGTRSVRVRNGDGKESNDLSFEVVATSTRITSLTPTAVTAGSPTFILTVIGTGFKTGATVLFDDAPLTTTLVSATEVHGEVPAASVAAPGLHTVQERNGDGGASNQLVFVVLPIAPAAQAVDPAFVIEGAGDVVVSITGERFAPGAFARLVVNNQLTQLDTTYVSNQRLTAVVPAQFTQSAGGLTIQVVNPDFGVSNAVTLRVFIRDPLVINEYLADPPGSAATDLIGDANGDGARSSSQDEFVEIINRTSEPVDISRFTLSDADSVRHVFAPGTIVPPFEVAVVFGGGRPKGSFGNAAEEHLVFTASSGGLSLNNGGDTITLADAQGRIIQQIKFGSAEGGAGQSINRDPDGNGATFALHTQVAHDTGHLFSPGTRATGEAFAVKPSVQTLTPARVHVGMAVTLVLTGINFAPGATVLLGSTPLATTFISDSRLEAQVSAAQLAEAGPLEIRVRNPKGETSAVTTLQVFDDPPQLTSLSPNKTGTGAENLELALTGERLQRGAVLLIGSQTVESEFVSKTTLKAILPAGLFTRVGTVSVQVKNVDGNLSNTLTIAVDYGPLITRQSLKRVNAGSGIVELTIGGVAFNSTVTLLVNDVAVPTSFVSDTSFTARIPATLTAQPGKLTLQARHADGGRSNRATLRVVE